MHKDVELLQGQPGSNFKMTIFTHRKQHITKYYQFRQEIMPSN